MKLLWHGVWINAPRYAVPADGTLVAVEAAVPVAEILHASGRIIRNPFRKAARFALSDGPSATLRKARTKLRERRFTGDYRIAAVLGRAQPDGRRVVALACRVPPAAQVLPIHPALMQPVGDDFSCDDLRGFADALAGLADDLVRLGRQSFLYSRQAPPHELVEAVHHCLATGSAAATSDSPVLIPVPPASVIADHATVHRPFSDRGIPIALLGAGDYARGEIIPALTRGRFERAVVADREPQIAALVSEEAGFATATADAYHAIDVLPRTGIVFIATAHDSHADLAAYALDAGHSIYLEKPAVVTEADLATLVDAVAPRGGALEIGFNRRYSTLARRAQRVLASETGPSTLTFVVKEVALQPDHWYLWPNQGTRITGNLCHWIDLGVFLLGPTALPVSVVVTPRVPGAPENADEERVLSVSFDEGSVLTVVATGRGDETRGVQELLDARRGETTVLVDDLWRMRIGKGGATRCTRTLLRDKGHRRMFRSSIARLASGRRGAYELRDLIVVSVIQIAASRLAAGDGGRADVANDVRDWLTRASVNVGRPTLST